MLPFTLQSQEIDLNDAQDLYARLNSGQFLPDDLETLKYLQQSIEDTLVIRKTFSDKNGVNHLEIQVINPCGENKHDGWINHIVVRLSNKNYSDTLIYYNPRVAMTLINLLERNIALKTVSGRQAVFFSFARCGNADDDLQVICIVFYDHKKYIYPINLRGVDFENYKIVDDLNEKFKYLPRKLRKKLIKHFNSQNKAAIWF
jgi:hypothetical protein